MGLVGEALSSVATALSEVEGDGESGGTRRNVHTVRGCEISADRQTGCSQKMTYGVPPAKSRPPILNDQPLEFQVQQAMGS